MNRNQNFILLLVLLISSAFSYYVFTNNVSFKSKTDEYVSPLGPKPSKVWERNWEIERAK